MRISIDAPAPSMHRRPSMPTGANRFATIVFGAIITAGACRGPEPESASQGEDEPVSPTDTPALGDPQAARLERGQALAHVLIAHPARLIDDIRNRIAPPGAGLFVTEAMLRGLAADRLGDRDKVAQHIDLESPLGCVLIDTAITKVPVACVVGYKGGIHAAIADLGDTDKVTDAQGHAAYYKNGRDHVFLDDLNGAVVASNHADVFQSARPYLEQQLVGRAETALSSIEIIGYAEPIAVRYHDELEQLLVRTHKPSYFDETASIRAFTDYFAKSSKTSLQRLQQLDQITLGLGAEDHGLILRWAAFPKPGSDIETQSKTLAAHAFQMQDLETLPASSSVVFGFNFPESLLSNPTTRDFKTALVNAYSAQGRRNADAVHARVDRFLAEESELYGDDVSVALVHVAGSLGGVVVSLVKEQPGRDAWKAWAASFDAKTILDRKTRKDLTWSFTPEVKIIDSFAVDRWVIEPTAKNRKALFSDASASVLALRDKMGGLALTIDRVELPDRVLFVLAPGTHSPATAAAVEAAQGTTSLAGDPGLARVRARSGAPSAVMAVHTPRLLDWVRELAPQGESFDLPLGSGFDDIYAISHYAADGSQHGQFCLSRHWVDALRARTASPSP